jgi:dihydrofolate reductase
MRKLIAGMKLSADGKMQGPDGIADWVEAWSEDYGLTPHIDTCLLGAGMYPGYELYWTAIQNEPDKVHPLTGKLPSPGEIEWARFAALTPHYVLSRSLHATNWPNTIFVRALEDVAALKQQAGKDIYLVGGGRTTASLIDAGLVDELRLIVYPLIAGEGKTLFAGTEWRRGLEMRDVRRLSDGRAMLVYGVGDFLATQSAA